MEPFVALRRPPWRGLPVAPPLLLLPLLLLAGCVASGDDRPTPPPGGPRPGPTIIPTDADTRACHADLRRADIAFTPLPDQRFGEGCAISGAVQLIDIGVPVTNLKAMRCRLAARFTAWTRSGVAPAARQILGSDLVRVETMGSYACRNVIGNAGYANRRSGHATANAVDVAGFVLADGRRITIARGWNDGDTNVRTFLRVIRTSACKRFGTVLGPDYNAAHYNHLHLEDDQAGFCR